MTDFVIHRRRQLLCFLAVLAAVGWFAARRWLCLGQEAAQRFAAEIATSGAKVYLDERGRSLGGCRLTETDATIVAEITHRLKESPIGMPDGASYVSGVVVESETVRINLLASRTVLSTRPAAGKGWNSISWKARSEDQQLRHMLVERVAKSGSLTTWSR